jgi:hypothetical protein
MSETYDMLIDEYLGAVTSGMGPGQKREVESELRTHILDSADALAAERKTRVDDAIVREVIRNMAPAPKLAAMYPAPGTFLQMKGLREAITGLGGLAFAFLLVAGILWLVAPDALEALPVQVVFSIAGALMLAIVVITCIFLAMYVYNMTLRVPYEARLKRLEKNLNETGSPLNVAGNILGTLVCLALLNIFWAQVPMISGLGGTVHLVRLFSGEFAGFLPWVNLFGMLTVAVNLLFLAMPRSKWVPATLESALIVCQALLNLWILQGFPFNTAELSATIQSGIKVFLAFVIVLMLMAAAVKLWKSVRLFLMSTGVANQKGGIP